MKQTAQHPRELEPLLGRALKSTSHIIDRRINTLIAENVGENLSPVQGRLLGFLHWNAGRDVYQKDVEAEFGVTRSTVATNLKLMEERGYIRREAVPGDARLKKLALTPQGEALHQKVHASLDQMENELRAMFAPEEYALLLELLQKIKTKFR